MIYTVPVTKAKKYLEDKEYIVTSDEAEAVAMACGEYLATGKPATVVIGENGVLLALDALITLVNLYEIPLNLIIFLRDDEPQHSMVTEHLKEVLGLYKVKAIFI